MKNKKRIPGALFHPLTYSVPFEVYELHKHIYWEFTIILKGKAKTFINKREYLVNKCDLFISKPNDMHRFSVLTKENYEHRDLYIDDEKMKQLCDFLQPDLYEFLINSTCLNVIHLSEDVMINLDKRMRQLQLSDPNNIKTEEHTIQYSLIAYMLGIFIENEHKKKQPYPEWIFSVLTHMNTSEVICGTLDSALSLTNYSHEHITREFKKFLGTSPIQYLTQKKMHFALALITNTDKSVLEISSQIGYDSTSHFIRKFKSTFGLSPGQYRKIFKSQSTN